MRILLVSPVSPTWTSRKHIHVGLGYLAGALLAAGYEVELFDAVVEDESLDDRLAGEPFDVVGVSSPTPLIYEAWEAAATAKRHGAVTILGGPHLTLLPDESMQRPEVDLVVRGEAEETIVGVVRALERREARGKGQVARGKLQVARGELREDDLPLASGLLPDEPWGDILGLSWRNLAGEVVHNPARPLRKDIDDLPWPAYHLFPIERYTNLNPITDGLDPHARAYTILTSRGCPYQCIYCSKPITGHTWRARSPENVVEEWAYLVRDMGATEIGVTDDVWNLSLERAKAICRLLVERGLNTVPWVTIHGMRAAPSDAELFQLMKAAGCKRVGFGVESGDQRVLDAIKKKQTVDEVRAAFGHAKAAGLQTMGFFIFGLPPDTEASMDATIRLALELDPDLGNFMIAAPFPGTEMYDVVRREGRLFSHDWRDFAIHDAKARFEMPGLPAELVERKWHEAYRRFYLRPGRIWRKATRLDTWRRLPTYAADFRRFFVGRGK